MTVGITCCDTQTVGNTSCDVSCPLPYPPPGVQQYCARSAGSASLQSESVSIYLLNVPRNNIFSLRFLVQ